MTSKFIKIPIADNNPVYTFEDFKVDFLAVTGIAIVVTPKNAQETHYLIADHRITQAHVDTLSASWPMIFFADDIPVGWTNYDIEA